MSSFSKRGYRNSLKSKMKLTKKHIKRFYEILHELDDVAKAIYEKYPNVEYSEDYLKNILPEFTELNIGKMEMNIILSKLQTAIDNENKRVVQH
jgi:predicted glycosyl hydrolase (DUF1957 family)